LFPDGIKLQKRKEMIEFRLLVTFPTWRSLPGVIPLAAIAKS
jgi:hypothetical protein